MFSFGIINYFIDDKTEAGIVNISYIPLTDLFAYIQTKSCSWKNSMEKFN